MNEFRIQGKPKHHACLSNPGGHWKQVQPRMSEREIERQKAHSRRADQIAKIMEKIG
jgi:hypothetical protein